MVDRRLDRYYRITGAESLGSLRQQGLERTRGRKKEDDLTVQLLKNADELAGQKLMAFLTVVVHLLLSWAWREEGWGEGRTRKERRGE